jgi:hypothetical protein
MAEHSETKDVAAERAPALEIVSCCAVDLLLASQVTTFHGWLTRASRLVLRIEGAGLEDMQERVLQTVMPAGHVETKHKVVYSAEEGFMSYIFPQWISAEHAKKFLGTPYVWVEEDGRFRLAQIWPTKVDEQFARDFMRWTRDPPPKLFPVIETEKAKQAFGKALERFLGQSVMHMIQYVYKEKFYDDVLLKGTGSQLLSLLHENEELREVLFVHKVLPDGFETLKFDSEFLPKKNKKFEMDLDVVYAMYRKTDGVFMGCVTPWDQFTKSNVVGKETELKDLLELPSVQKVPLVGQKRKAGM